MKKKSIMGLEFKWEVLIVYLVSILGLVFSFMKDKDVDKDVKLQYNQAGVIFIINAILTIISRSTYSFGLWYISSVVGIIEIVIFVFALVAVIKAFSNESYEIPVISDLAKSLWK